MAEAQTQIDTLTAEKDQLAVDWQAKYDALVESDAAQLEALQTQYTELSINYQALIQDKDDFQKAYEAMEDDVNARLALAQTEEESDDEDDDSSDVVDISEVDFTDEEQIRAFSEKYMDLVEAYDRLTIENLLLREQIENYTK